MTSAQRRKKIAKFKKSKKKIWWPKKKDFPWKKFFLLPAALLVVFVYVWLTGRTFAKNSKITVVVNGRDRVYISTFDKETGTIFNLTIPANTQVNVSRQLGTWKAESVWQLGENEKLAGSLLAETILKNFKIPINAWADYPFDAISEGRLNSIFRSILPYKTSLGTGDKIRLALFSLMVSPAKRTNLDLAKESFLRKTKLVGGEEGYVLSENFPQSLYYLFSDSKINSANLRVEIQNYSERRSGTDLVAATLEVLGGKAAAISKFSAEDFFCEVSGKDKEMTRAIAEIFGCKEFSKDLSDNFDITLKIGEEFARRF